MGAGDQRLCFYVAHSGDQTSPRCFFFSRFCNPLAFFKRWYVFIRDCKENDSMGPRAQASLAPATNSIHLCAQWSRWPTKNHSIQLSTFNSTSNRCMKTAWESGDRCKLENAKVPGDCSQSNDPNNAGLHQSRFKTDSTSNHIHSHHHHPNINIDTKTTPATDVNI